MEFLCQASATGHTTSLKNGHAQSCHAKMRPAGQAIVAGTDYNGIEIERGEEGRRTDSLLVHKMGSNSL
jgi:hypothetical protein